MALLIPVALAALVSVVMATYYFWEWQRVRQDPVLRGLASTAVALSIVHFFTAGMCAAVFWAIWRRWFE